MSEKKPYENLPETPGVYIMKAADNAILYIGKAGNLKRRVSSYFLRPHEFKTEKLVQEIAKIDYEKTDTAIEALILEAKLIKKYEPPYNVREKDDKSFLSVEITREAFPRVLLVRGREIHKGKPLARYGPFTSATSIRESLRIIRRIFPYSTHSLANTNRKAHTNTTNKNARPCFEYEIGLCPGTCMGAISRKEYLKNIKNIKLFFEGKKKQIIKSLYREMEEASRRLEFEKAEKLRRQIFSLQHIQDVSLISNETIQNSELRIQNYRIEGYDVSNISGDSATGAMVVFTNGKSDKREYRKFRIQTLKTPDDVGMLKEVLRRRFSRNRQKEGWPLPNLILIDGGVGQVNAAKDVLGETGLALPIIGIAKGAKRKNNRFTPHLWEIVPQISFLGEKKLKLAKSSLGKTDDVSRKAVVKKRNLPKVTGFIGQREMDDFAKVLIQVRNEAHRFAVSYHKKLRYDKMIS